MSQQGKQGKEGCGQLHPVENTRREDASAKNSFTATPCVCASTKGAAGRVPDDHILCLIK